MKDNISYVLIFSGGGVEGVINHLGFYKAFCRYYFNGYVDNISLNTPLSYNNKSIKRIIGTSAGAVVGSFIASGYSYNFLEKMLLEKVLSYKFLYKLFDNPFNIFFDGALLKNKPLLVLYKKYLPVYYQNILIPFNAIATEMDTGQLKMFKEGKLAPSVMASQSIPVVFPYIEIDNHYYLDGAIVRNLENRLVYKYIKYINKNKSKYTKKVKFIIVDMDKHIDDIDISYNPLQILYNGNRICRKYYEQYDYESIKDLDNVIYLLKEVNIQFTKTDFLYLPFLRQKIKKEIERISNVYYEQIKNNIK